MRLDKTAVNNFFYSKIDIGTRTLIFGIPLSKEIEYFYFLNNNHIV